MPTPKTQTAQSRAKAHQEVRIRTLATLAVFKEEHAARRAARKAAEAQLRSKLEAKTNG